MKKHFKGFTLSELLLCIGIIGVVSAMGMTITKISTDRAYNLYYYTGYTNLYNAIADAKANGIESNQEIMQHVTQLLSKDENNIAFATDMPFSSYKAVLLANNISCPSGYKLQGTKCLPLKHVIDDEKTTLVPPTRPDWSGHITGNGSGSGNDGSGDGTGGGDGDGTGDGSGDGSGSGSSSGSGSGDVTPNGTITRAIPITMTVPQRKTRNNPDGFATVRLLYINLNGGYLIPITAGSSVDLQNRRDLLPAFIDDGKVGRNNALNRNNGFVYTRPAYGTYREMFCSLSGLGSIDTVISCNGINSNKTGALKVVDPRKAK